MLATLTRSYPSKQWIVATVWNPHWLFQKWNMRYLWRTRCRGSQVHGLWIEYKVADTLTLEQVLVFFHATIDNATGKLWQETIAMMEQA